LTPAALVRQPQSQASNVRAKPDDVGRHAERRPRGSSWKQVREELREVVWLASVIGILSAAGVGLAVALAAA
jgi:hypothetical protein